MIEAGEELFGRFREFTANLLGDKWIVHRRHAGLGRLKNVERFAGQQIRAGREHLNELHEGAAQLLGAFDDAPRVFEVGIEQFAVVAAGTQERTPQRGPQITRADLRGESAYLECTARATAGEIPALGHQSRSRARPTRLIRVAAKSAPKPLSIFTTVTPPAQLFSIPSSAAMAPNEAP